MKRCYSPEQLSSKRTKYMDPECETVLLMVAQHLPVLPATIASAVALRALNKRMRISAPHWPNLAAIPGKGIALGPGTLGLKQLMFLHFARNSIVPNDQRKYKEMFAISRAAAAAGRTDVLDICLLHFSNVRLWPNVMDAAAEAGRLEILQWMADKGQPIFTTTMYEAVRHGWLHIVQWISAKQRQYFNDAEIQRTAAQYGQMHILEWMLEQNQPKYPATLTAAIRANRSDVIQWLVERGYAKTEYQCSIAAYGGNIATLEFLRNLGFPWDARVCSEASRGGNLPLLQWARERDCPWDENVCLHAASNGYVDILAWAKANGCPWHNDVYYLMVNSGKIDVPQWAVEQGWRVTRESILFARRVGSFIVGDMLEREWVRQQRETK